MIALYFCLLNHLLGRVIMKQRIFLRPFICCAALTILFNMPTTTAVHAQELLGVVEVPGNAMDLSERKEKLSQGTPHNQLGGFSAMDYSPVGNVFLVAPDRGPDDGAVDYQCRIQTVQIRFDPFVPDEKWSHVVTKTTMLFDSKERPFIGQAAQFTANETTSHRFDPEGIRVFDDGRFVISDEYGPYVVLFSPEGKEIKRFQVPEHYLIKNPGINKPDENGKNKIGRQTNRGMEGLTISKDGQYLYGLMQSPLLQDSRMSDKGKPKGVNCRLIRINMETGETAEYVYVLDDEDNKLNEILAISDTEFLVIERDGEAGEEAKFKKIMKIDIADATPFDGSESLSDKGLPNSIKPVKKQVLIDLLDPKYKLAGEKMPEKIEGLCFGPNWHDGRQTLFISSDNDFQAEQPTRVYMFALGERKVTR